MDVSSPLSRSPKRILYVVTKANWGGAQRYVLDLAQAARAQGFVAAIAYGEPGLLVDQAKLLCIQTYQVPGLGRDISLADDIRACWQMFRLFRRVRPDVVHLNSSKASASGALAGRLAGVRRIIFTAHGWAFNEERSILANLIFQVIQYATVLLSHRTITVSKALASQARSWPGVQKRIRTIHHGISPPSMLSRKDARSFLISRDPSLELSREGLWVGTIAELHPNKGLDIGVEAWREAGADMPGMQWVVLGGGSQELGLRESIRGIPGIHLLGFTADAARYLLAFDLFLLPSRTEAFGYVILEAGSGGIPVIASNVGGIPEILSNDSFGILFPRGDHHALAEQLRSFFRDPEPLRRTGSSLRERVQARFSLERMIRETYTLY